MQTSAIKKQTFICSFYFIKQKEHQIFLIIWFILKHGIMEFRCKRKHFYYITYIADVSLLTNPNHRFMVVDEETWHTRMVCGDCPVNVL